MSEKPYPIAETLARYFYLKMQILDPVGDPEWEELDDATRRLYVEAMKYALWMTDMGPAPGNGG